MEINTYIVKIDDSFIKHTSRFGPFYGSIVTTNNINEARFFVNEHSAINLVNVIKYRLSHAAYKMDIKKFPNYKNCTYQKIKL